MKCKYIFLLFCFREQNNTSPYNLSNLLIYFSFLSYVYNLYCITFINYITLKDILHDVLNYLIEQCKISFVVFFYINGKFRI